MKYSSMTVTEMKDGSIWTTAGEHHEEPMMHRNIAEALKRIEAEMTKPRTQAGKPAA